MTTFEKAFREYAAKHPDASVEEATHHAEQTEEFEAVFRKLDPSSQQIVHDMIAAMVEGREGNG